MADTTRNEPAEVGAQSLTSTRCGACAAHHTRHERHHPREDQAHLVVFGDREASRPFVCISRCKRDKRFRPPVQECPTVSFLFHDRSEYAVC